MICATNNCFRSGQLLALIWGVFFIGSCTLQSVFDQHAYERSIELKVKSMALMERAKSSSFSSQKEAISGLKTDLEILMEYESRRKNNEESTRMVWMLKSPDKGLLGSFLDKWEASRGNMSEYFVDQAKGQIEEAFNLLIELESGKIKRSNERVQALISK